MINKFLAAVSHTSSGFQLINFLHPNTHAALEVGHCDTFSSWRDLVDSSVGFSDRLRALVLEVATSFAKNLPGGHEGLVLFQVKETIGIGVGI